MESQTLDCRSGILPIFHYRAAHFGFLHPVKLLKKKKKLKKKKNEGKSQRKLVTYILT